MTHILLVRLLIRLLLNTCLHLVCYYQLYLIKTDDQTRRKFFCSFLANGSIKIHFLNKIDPMEEHQKSPSSPASSSGSNGSVDLTFPLALDDPVGDRVEKRLLEIRKEIAEMTAEANARANRPPAGDSSAHREIYDEPTQLLSSSQSQASPASPSPWQASPGHSQASLDKIQAIIDGNEVDDTYDAHPDLLGDTDTYVSSQASGLETSQQRPSSAAKTTPAAKIRLFLSRQL